MARSAEVWSRRQHSGCVWLQSCVFFATVCRSLPSEVLDFLGYLSKSKKFETRYPPHLVLSLKIQPSGGRLALAKFSFTSVFSVKKGSTTGSTGMPDES